MYKETIVIDNGSETCRAGFSGEDAPRSSFRLTDYQLPKSQKTNIIVRGNIIDWDSMEEIWRDILREKLKTDSAEHPVLITECASSGKNNREKIIQMWFEKFQSPALYVATPAILSMYGCGQTTGVIMDLGHGVAHTVPIYQGYAVTRAEQRLPYAGSDLTDHLVTILHERGHRFTTNKDRQLVHDIKEQLCYVAEDFDKELLNNSSLEKEYRLPDGAGVVSVGNERFRCPEALFQPQFIGSAACGVHESVYNAIMHSDVDIRRDLYANVIVTGGSTLFPGFVERMRKELKLLSPPNVDVKLKGSQDRLNTVWIGGSILSSLTLFQSMWITKKDYDESGPSVVHKKCY